VPATISSKLGKHTSEQIPAYDTEASEDTFMKSILDRSFRYTKSVDTDLRKTFARIRRDQRRQPKVPDDNPTKVFAIDGRKRAAS